MEQSLSISLSQRLAMTTQLQQAIQILQLSAQDLRAEIEKEYLENPALELDYPDTPGDDLYAAGNIHALADYLSGRGGEDAGYEGGEQQSFETAAPVTYTLEEELLAQAKFAFPEERDLAIATFIIGSIDDRGYLTVPMGEIARASQATEAAVSVVLAKVQSFDPAGVGARDLSECLRLQAQRKGIYEGLVAAVIDRHLAEVAEADFKAIAKAEFCHLSEVQLAVDAVRQLDPKPGSAYGAEPDLVIEPDVFVKKIDGEYRVVLNDNGVPQLHISRMYQQAEHFDAKTQKYITGRLRAAEWLIRSIAQRRETIRHVVEEIVRRQRDYLEKGPAFLHAMTMKDVADAIDVHESTVSRAVANKYAQLPGGIVPLRKFFTANLAKDGGDFIASQAKTAIGEMIRGEDPHHPLSDQKICTQLEARGMTLSRRTVMKYREHLGFPSSTKRKRY